VKESTIEKASIAANFTKDLAQEFVFDNIEDSSLPSRDSEPKSDAQVTQEPQPQPETCLKTPELSGFDFSATDTKPDPKPTTLQNLEPPSPFTKKEKPSTSPHSPQPPLPPTPDQSPVKKPDPSNTKPICPKKNKKKKKKSGKIGKKDSMVH
jgi:hypothetical protein